MYLYPENNNWTQQLIYVYKVFKVIIMEEVTIQEGMRMAQEALEKGCNDIVLQNSYTKFSKN